MIAHMVDPTAYAAVALTLKIIDFAFDANKAIWSSGLGESDFKAVKSLLGILKELRALKGAVPEQRTAARAHEEMTLTAFSMAWQTHWANSPEVLKNKKTKQEAAACLATARGLFPPEVDGTGKPAVAHHALLRGCPTRSPAFGMLWKLFSEEELLHEPASSQHQFTRDFRTAWAGLLPTPLGEPLRRPHRDERFAEAVREVLAWDFIDWRTRHVFGNQRDHDALPAMPLDRVYVEPVCEPEKPEEAPIPIQTKLDAWLQGDSTVALVTADFGHGKSLSARMFASRLAEKYLEGDSASTAERWWPIFVRCASELRSDSLPHSVALAQREQLHRAGFEKLPQEHPAIQTPEPDHQKTVLILDGLDEVNLTSTQTRDLLVRLQDFGSGGRRIVVFTRPGAVAQQERPKGVPVFKLRSFGEHQIERWLAAWREVAPPSEDLATLNSEGLKQRGLQNLAATPILLFMIACTWRGEAPQGMGEVDIYDQFFTQLARSKCKHDPDAPKGHPEVLAAATRLRDVLVAQGLGPRGQTPEQAMLWLLGFVAWEHARSAQKEEPLVLFQLKSRLQAELKLAPDEQLRAIQKGLMLVLQVDPFGEDPAIEFGHRTFREYLIAQYWRAHLVSGRATSEIERMLLGARLLERGSKALDFLVGLVRRDGSTVARRVAKLAEGIFLDERLNPSNGSPRDDQRKYLREAGLAIRCLLGEKPFRLAEPNALLSLDRMFSMEGLTLSIIAPGIRLRGANLEAVCTSFEARLTDADLSGANLKRAYLWEADLRRACLRKASLDGAELSEGDLREADLTEAEMWDTHLHTTKMDDARCRKAQFAGSRLFGLRAPRADFSEVNFRFADIRSANFNSANMSMADFYSARLDGSDFRGANLEGAILCDARLESANFEGANLARANLRRALLGSGPDRVRGLRRALNLEQAYLPKDFTFLPEDT